MLASHMYVYTNVYTCVGFTAKNPGFPGVFDVRGCDDHSFPS